MYKAALQNYTALVFPDLVLVLFKCFKGSSCMIHCLVSFFTPIQIMPTPMSFSLKKQNCSRRDLLTLKFYPASSASLAISFRGWQEWRLSHGDFLDGTAPSHSINMLNQAVNAVVKAFKSFHQKPEVRNVLVEAMKFCVPSLSILMCGNPVSDYMKTIDVDSISWNSLSDLTRIQIYHCQLHHESSFDFMGSLGGVKDGRDGRDGSNVHQM